MLRRCASRYADHFPWPLQCGLRQGRITHAKLKVSFFGPFYGDYWESFADISVILGVKSYFQDLPIIHLVGNEYLIVGSDVLDGTGAKSYQLT